MMPSKDLLYSLTQNKKTKPEELIQHLYHKLNEPGIRDFIINKFYSLPPHRIQFYLP